MATWSCSQVPRSNRRLREIRVEGAQPHGDVADALATMREQRYQWHPALERFVVPETPNILRVKWKKRLVENEWNVTLGLSVMAVGVVLALLVRGNAALAWGCVAAGAIGGVVTTALLERAQRDWLEIQRRSSYWRITRGKGKKRDSVETFDMAAVTDAEIEEDELGMWLLVYVKDQGPKKLIGRSFRWTWMELEAMREELLCPRVTDLC